MEVLGSVDIFLTPNQRNWMNAMKNAAAKKPKKKIKRPEVMMGVPLKVSSKTDLTQWKIEFKKSVPVLISLTIFLQYRTAIKQWCLTWWKIATLRSLLFW